MGEMLDEIVKAAKTLIATRPVFRSKPVGFEGSAARLQQQDEIAAEDALLAAIAKAERRTYEP